ncbi:MAG: tetraacyldisaccharide 4'-kinase [Planctomycetes bacterium]|nr:tetraacyldisaccharide 4'-kinase [Planctomycetota bacterium]
MDQENYRRLISGASSGWNAKALRALLALAAKIYVVVIRLRNLLYCKGILKAHQAKATVISIGNITAGGTGKTPLVIWLCNLLQEKATACAILTRGYKTKKDKFSDEPAILAKSCPKAKVIVNSDRVAGATEAVTKFGAKALIMDDGFQHRRLKRDLDIVTIDGTEPFGYEKMLPAGLLREPIAGLARADAAVITRCNQTSQAELEQLARRLQSINPDIVIAKTVHAPVYAKFVDQTQINLEELNDKKIFAFCGIGNPGAFLNTLKGLGFNLAGWKIHNDHYRYKTDDIIDIYEQAKDAGADLILSTQKDWTKTVLLLPQAMIRGGYKFSEDKKEILFAYLAIELEFMSGEDKLRDLIEDTLAGKISKNKGGKA